MKLRTLLAFAICAASLAMPSVAADPFPSRAITLIVPWPAGGPTDTYLRKLAEITSRHLGQPMIIENKPGAGGMLGPAAMARSAAPDGYTLSQLTVSAFRQVHMQKVDWDPVRDFTYVIGVSGYTFGVAVKADSPFRDFNDLVAYAKANPGRMSYGSTGTGTSPHLLMEELAGKAGVQFLHVPFKGNADSTQALMGGHVMAQSDASGWGKFVDQGTFRLLVTFGEQRARWGSPTAKELGYDIVSYSPFGIVGPRGMDPKVVRVLHDAFRKALDDPEHHRVMQQLDQVSWYRSSEDYTRWAAETVVSERALIERLGLMAK
ncbi:MAG: tripartite tricarboxylate transporter substrate binding protein [Burkholderiales bacterium]|nr:tripartite tricarboxylate transporter substrate binding protein [Burkholderiales bacterium]